MPRKQKSIHYLYKTTCLVTGRYYIGMHSTSSLEDGYMGSGKRLRYSIRKYGVENHVKEILEFFDSRELLVEAEKTAITSDMLNDVMCMNMMSGGTGGFISVEQQRYRSSCAGKAIADKRKNNDDLNRMYKELASKTIKETHKNGKIRYDVFKGKKHSEVSKQKMREAKLGKKLKSDNSQYGTMWITNGTENRKIKKEDFIPSGWYKGRKLVQ